ncbi:MAG: hypothetical protein ABSE06_13845 [Anaerolineaceae bacterium]|jgi:hypothetical protein
MPGSGFSSDHPSQIYQVFNEHFRIREKALKTKTDQELTASSLQSPEDLKATYR